MSIWTDPLWLAEAHEWIHRQLERTGTGIVGPIEQPHIYPWSTVLRVPTEPGEVYFKANAATFRHEAALVKLLAARRPDCVPPLLAVEADPDAADLCAAVLVQRHEVGERIGLEHGPRRGSQNAHMSVRLTARAGIRPPCRAVSAPTAERLRGRAEPAECAERPKHEDIEDQDHDPVTHRSLLGFGPILLLRRLLP